MNKAAEALYISQPALTSAIKELERESGLSIFLRIGKGVVPTAEGAEFLTSARQVYQQYELLQEKFCGFERGNFKKKFGVSTQHYSFAVKAFVEMVKNCNAYVYMWRSHPLAGQASVSLAQLADYPCLSFEQGENSSVYFAEEILSENEYQRIIKANDRATMLNLMVGLNGYTLCSGIICEELNGSDYVAVPFAADDLNRNSVMEIGYITKRDAILSRIGEVYIEEIEKYLREQTK